MGLGIPTKSYKVRILRKIYIQLAWLYKITSYFPNKTVLKSCEVMYTELWMNLERWYPFWHFLLLDLTMLDLHKNHLYVGQWHQQNKNRSLKRSVKWNGLNVVSGWSSWKIEPSTEPQRTERLPVNLILKLFFPLWMTGKLRSTWLLCLDTTSSEIKCLTGLSAVVKNERKLIEKKKKDEINKKPFTALSEGY